MKKIYLCVLIILLGLVFLPTDQGSAQNSINYYTICKQMDSLYTLNPKLKSTEDGDYEQYIRWKNFWRTRVMGKNQNNTGSFDISLQAWKQFNSNGKYSDTSVIGSDWISLGPDTLPYHNMGQVTSIYVDTINDKSMNTIYVGSASSGIWKTYDGGHHWHNITDGSRLSITGITSIIGDPKNTDILYAAIGGGFMGQGYDCGIGILKSTDQGVTWRVIYPSGQDDHHISVFKLIMDPYNDNFLYAAVDSLLVRSADAGNSWQTIFKIHQFPPAVSSHETKSIHDIEMKPFDSTTLYIATDDLSTWVSQGLSQIWKLRNIRAQDTSMISKEELDLYFNPPILTKRWELAVTPADPDSIYAQCAAIAPNNTENYYLWKGSNTTWNLKLNCNTNAKNVLGVGYYKNTLAVSPTNPNILYVGGTFMYKFRNDTNTLSTYEGAHEGYFLPSFHADVRYAVLMNTHRADTGGTDYLFVGNDGGISKTINGTKNWTSINGHGLTITQFWGMGGQNSNGPTVAAGAQDNSLFIYNKNSMHSWDNPSNVWGDAGDVVFDYYKPNVLYFTLWGSETTSIIKDSLAQTTEALPIYVPDSNEKFVVSVPLMLNPGNKHALYCGYHDIFRTYDQGASHDSIRIPVWDSLASGRPISSFCFSKIDTMTIYAAMDWEFASSLLKSHNNNGQYVWENITWPLFPSTNCPYKYKITSLEISPTNKDSVWVAFGGFLNDDDTNHVRVMLSRNGGASWDTSYSHGLPNMPVNCIKYAPKGKRIFAATDAGVFYRDYTMSTWQSFNNGLPVCVVSDLEIDDSILYASTFGRGMYSTDLRCIYNNNPLVINNNETWTSDRVMENSIFIDSSYALTISHCTVKFPPAAKIYVKQGARLILDSATLTNNCNNMWQGIEVWGRSNIPQNLPYQGLVCVTNSSVIENARIGITTNNKTEGGKYCLNSSGGIIIVQNSTFRNNYKALEFLNYKYPQISEVTQSVFETRGTFVDGESYPSNFISIDSANGLKFMGCKFLNWNSSTTEIPDALKGNGIYSTNGSFLVGKYDYCPQRVSPCPDPQSVPSLFQGLYYGIKVINSNPANAVDIQRTHLKDCYRGIYLASTNYANIVQDTIEIPNGTNHARYDTCYGVYFDRCSLYNVQENILSSTYYESTYGTNSPTIGFVVNNSGTDVNEIYNNKFDSVMYGIIAQNQNRNPYDTTGLCIKCNDFSHTKYDIAVNQQGTNSDWGVARNQGWKQYPKDPAGNLFSMSHKNGTNALADIDNEDGLVNYYHHFQPNNASYRVKPDYSDINKVIKKSTNWSYSKNDDCPSKLSGGGGSGSEEELKQQLVAQQQSVDSISSTLLVLTDGGSTSSLNSTVAYSDPSQTYQILQQLMGYSPYLSDTVMETAINKEDVLPNEMIRDILVANPQAPKSEGVMNQLNNRYNPMPDSMLAEIQTGISILGAKDSLGALLYNHLQSKHDIFKRLVTLYKSDTINPSVS